MTKRIIWCAEFDGDRARATAAQLRRQGRKARVYTRAVRAEGLYACAFIVVTDAEPAPPYCAPCADSTCVVHAGQDHGGGAA